MIASIKSPNHLSTVKSKFRLLESDEEVNVRKLNREVLKTIHTLTLDNPP